MHKYEIIIYWSERYGHYIAEVPELPGCMADGDTPFGSQLFDFTAAETEPIAEPASVAIIWSGNR